MYALMYPILYIASIHCYIPLSTATSISMCSVCIVLWHDHVNGEIKALKKKKKKKEFLWNWNYDGNKIHEIVLGLCGVDIQSGGTCFYNSSVYQSLDNRWLTNHAKHYIIVKIELANNKESKWLSTKKFLLKTLCYLVVMGCSLCEIHSRHWWWDEMTAISQTTLSNAFSWIKYMHFD